MCTYRRFDLLLLQIEMTDIDWRLNQDMLECTICAEEMEVARVLACGHSFCHKCLERCLKHHVVDGHLPCPTCRALYKVTSEGVDAIPKNVFVNNLIEAAHEQGPDKVTAPGVGKGEVVKRNSLPSCPAHDHMFLDLFCEDCQTPMCATCVPLTHRDHKCIEIISKMGEFKTQLEKLLTQTDSCLQTVEEAIHATKKQANKIKADVNTLKQQVSASYQAIIQFVKKEEQTHLAAIDKGYHQIQKRIAEAMDIHQTAEAQLCSIRRYAKELKKSGTDYDYITNVKSLTDRYARASKECSQPAEVKWVLDVSWEECRVGVKGVGLSIKGGTGSLDENINEKISTFPTECEDNIVTGIVSCHNHLMVTHYGHNVIYIYDEDKQLKSSVKVSGMSHPHGICLVQGDAATQHLVVADYHGKYLWWLKVEKQAGQVKLGQPQKHKVGYRPFSAVTTITGQALICDYDNGRLYVYSQPLHKGNYIQLTKGVKPRVAVSDPTGEYMVSDEYRLVWVNEAGLVTRRYKDQPAVVSRHMVHDGTDWLVADRDNRCIHVVTEEGKHGGYVVTKKQGVRKPTRVCVDADRHRLWLGDRSQDDKGHIMKVEDYSPLHVTTFTMSATLPKLPR